MIVVLTKERDSRKIERRVGELNFVGAEDFLETSRFQRVLKLVRKGSYYRKKITMVIIFSDACGEQLSGVDPQVIVSDAQKRGIVTQLALSF